MITKSFTFRLLFLLLTIPSIIFIISSCDLGDDNQYYAGTTGYNIIGTQVIGSAGGEINLDSIIVKVPNGAFNEDNELNIYVGIEKDGFEEYGNTALYQIDGLPSTVNKPIRLNIKYNGTNEGDTLVAIGEMGIATSLDSSLVSYHTESASDSAGYLVYDLPSYSSLAKISESDNATLEGALNIIGLFGYKEKLSSKGHFEISYPLLIEQQAITIGEHFETAYSKCQAMGFSYPVRKWPADVLVKSFKRRRYGFYSWRGNASMTDEILKSLIDKGRFTIDSGIINEDPLLRTVIGHEFLHLVQNLYEFSSPIEPEQKWLQEATSVWIQEKYVNVSNYVPPQYNNKEYYALDGWQYKDRKYATHGYALSFIIKDIAETYGDRAIVKIFEAIQAGILPSNAVDPVDAVLSGIDEPIEYFWHRVLGDYIAGEYYNNKVNFKILDNPNMYRKAVAIDANDSLHIFSENYWDLSGGLFKVTPGDTSTFKKGSIEFTVSDTVNCGIVVFKYKQGSEIIYLGDALPGGNGKLIVNNVKQVFKDGYDFVAMVTNSTHDKTKNYQGANYNVDLKIELSELGIKSIEIDAGISATFRTTSKTSGNSFEDDRSHYGIDGFIGNGNFSINGNTIVGTQDSLFDYLQTSTKIGITFDNINSPTKIIAFSLDKTEVNINQPTTIVSSLAGENVPFGGSPWGDPSYQTTYWYDGDFSQYMTKFTQVFDENLWTIELISYDGRGLTILITYDE